ncbi:MAG: radical SAM protein, partial [Candidatus Omnitrophota bacterium]
MVKLFFNRAIWVYKPAFYFLILTLLLSSVDISLAADLSTLRAINPAETSTAQFIETRLLSPAPSLLEIEITNFCNLGCSICRRGNPDYQKEPPKHMTLDEFKRIIDSYDYPLPRIQFCGTSEPTANPDLPEMIRYVVANKNPHTVEIITNGTMLTPKLGKTLIQAGITAMRVSVDGPDEETYQAIRRQPLAHVAENIRGFRAECRKSGRDISIWINCTITKDNIDKISDMPSFAHAVGADILELRLFETNLEHLEALAVYDRATLDDLRQKVLQAADDAKIRLVLWDIEDRVDDPCLLTSEAHINWQGYLTPCYHLPHSRIGAKLGRKPFSQHWRGDKAISILQSAKDGTPLPICNCLYAIEARERSSAQLFQQAVSFHNEYRAAHPASSNSVAQQMTIEYLKENKEIFEAVIHVLTPENVYLFDGTADLIYVLTQIWKNAPQVVMRTIPAQGTDIYCSVDETQNGILAYDHDQRRLYRHGPDGKELVEWYPGIEIDEHIKGLKREIAGRETLTITDHNLYFNDFCLIFSGGRIYHKAGEFDHAGLPINNRTYTCMVAWKEAVSGRRFTIERLTFEKSADDTQTDRVYRLTDDSQKEDITSMVENAFYGQQIIKNNDGANVADIADEFDD